MSEAAQALGLRLKAEREKRGVSAQKMADDMHLDAWVIDALEAGDYERIGPSVYAQGHLRKYASILGVSSAPPTPAPPVKPPGTAAPTPIIRLDPPRGGVGLWPTVGGFAVVALVAGGIAWWRPWHSTHAPRPAAAAAPPAASAAAAESIPATRDSVAGSAPAPAAEPVAATATDSAAAPTDSAGTRAAEAAAGVSTAAAAPVRAEPQSVAELTPGVGRARLRLSFSADSRVAVYDYTGKAVFSGTGRANSVKTLSGMAPFRVFLGFASGVQLQVNDRAVAIGPQFMSGDVARFEAGADGVLRRDPRPAPAGGAAAASAPRG